MGRPREFDDGAVMEAAIQCFWDKGFEATSVRDLVERTGLTAASLYNAYGDKRSLFRSALDQYIESSIGARISRCERLPGLDAIKAFFNEILRRSLSDREHKGCMMVNAALEVAPHDPEFRKIISVILKRVEVFFRVSIERGQMEGTIAHAVSAPTQAQHLLGVLMGVRVLSRVRPEKALLEGLVASGLAHLQTNS